MTSLCSRFDLGDIIAPVSVPDFLRDYAFQKPLFVPGNPSKFTEIFSWASLNRILSNSRHDSIRVHLDQVGYGPEQFTFTHSVRNVRGEDIRRLDVAALYGHLRNGATLVVDAVNEVDPSIAELTERIGALMTTTEATTVLFASFGHDPGFSIHWDSRDVYALQVEGEKQWSVYEPSKAAPMDRGDASIPGSGEPGRKVWEGTLARGDMLYIPRGWWHIATSGDTPSLHLAIGMAPVTGMDFMAWLATRLRDQELLRRDIPRLTTADTLNAYTDALLAAVKSELHARAVDDFLRERRAASRAQTYLSLPAGVTGLPYNAPDNTEMRLSTLMLEVNVEGDSLLLRGGGRQMHVPLWARPLVECLSTGEATTLLKLKGTLPDRNANEISEIISAMIHCGFVHSSC